MSARDTLLGLLGLCYLLFWVAVWSLIIWALATFVGLCGGDRKPEAPLPPAPAITCCSPGVVDGS